MKIQEPNAPSALSIREQSAAIQQQPSAVSQDLFYSPLKINSDQGGEKSENDYAEDVATKKRDRANSDEAVEIMPQSSVRSKINS